jgi:eukaryotic-like serine/threonine-protein kinase
VIRFTVSPPEGKTFGGLPSPQVSPDGRRIVFETVSKEGYQYWIRWLDSPNLVAEPATNGASLSFWSPDSQSIGFFANDKLKKIDLSGSSEPGQAVTLCAAPSYAGGTWSKSGVILFSIGPGPIYRVPDTGGSPIPATRLDDASKEIAHIYPWFLPDGRHFLFEAGGLPGVSNNMTIRIGSLDSQDSKILLTSSSNAIFAQGFLLFVRDDTLMAQRFDPQKLRTAGDVVPIVEHMTTFGASAPFSASENGPLVYIAGSETPSFALVWFDRNGIRLSTLGDLQSPIPPMYSPQLSPDGRIVAETHREQNNTDIWLYDVAHGSRTRFTFDPATEIGPVWSHDGRTIAFASSRSGHSDIYRKAADQSGAEELLFSDSENNYPTSLSPDGEYLLFDHISNKKPRGSVWILPLKAQSGRSPKPFRLTQNSAGDERAQFSPDGRWILYESEESGRSEVYVAPSPVGGGAAGGKRQISTAGGASARWRKDGKEIFYLQNRRLVSVPAEIGNGALRIGEERQIVDGLSILGFDITPDGQRFLLRLRSPQAASQPLTVVQNWTSMLKR